jgi:hypothetical protein
MPIVRTVTDSLLRSPEMGARGALQLATLLPLLLPDTADAASDTAAAAASAQRLLAKLRIGAVPSRSALSEVFGPWIDDAETVANVSLALTGGSIVIIEGGLNVKLAQGLRDELTRAEFVRSDGAHAGEELARISATFQDTFFAMPESERCDAVKASNGGEFFFSHQRPADYNSVPLSRDTSNSLDAPAVRGWIDKILDHPKGTIGSSEWGVRRFDMGDVYSLHNDDTNGRFGGLSLTAYFTNPDQPWDVNESGGQFVWCADAQSAPVAIAPSFNTLVLFRVDRNTNHYVEPLLKGSKDNPRYVFQGWWRPSAGVLRPDSLHPDSRSVLRVAAGRQDGPNKGEL